MGTETERKFLVTGDGWRTEADRGTALLQAYLTKDGKAEVRVRILEGKGARLTIKSAGPALSRAEFEYEIPTGDAEALLSLCYGGVIEKRRFRVPAGPGLTWEIDIYGGRHRGLIVAEIELPESGNLPEIPEWIGRELTGDPAYTNAALSLEG